MNPTGQPSFGLPPSPQGPGVAAGDPKEAVNVPSLILLIGAAGGIGLHLLSMLMNLMGSNQLPREFTENPDLKGVVQFSEAMQKAGPVLDLLGIALCGFLLFGALKMRNLQNWGLSLATCIVAIIPCCYSCCCVATLVGGIWGLVVLNQPHVKAAFTN